MKKIFLVIFVILAFLLLRFTILDFSFDFNLFNLDGNSVSCQQYDCAIEFPNQEFVGKFEKIEDNILYVDYNNDSYGVKLAYTENYNNKYIEDLIPTDYILDIKYEFIDSDNAYVAWVYLNDDNKNQFLLQDLLLKNNEVTSVNKDNISNVDEIVKLEGEYGNINELNKGDKKELSKLFNFNSIKNSNNSANNSKDTSKNNNAATDTNPYANNKLVEVQACNLSGDRKSNVKVDIGMDTPFANRNYYAYTNSTGQLVYIHADKIIVQNDAKEKKYQKGDGRYCSDEAKVPGVESKTLDEGHAIADSLGGVSNAYNITPQDSNLNRRGDQYQMEEQIRNASYDGKSVTDFNYEIIYANNTDTIPTSYKVSYKINNKPYNLSYNNVA